MKDRSHALAVLYTLSKHQSTMSVSVKESSISVETMHPAERTSRHQNTFRGTPRRNKAAASDAPYTIHEVLLKMTPCVGALGRRLYWIRCVNRHGLRMRECLREAG